MKGVADGFPTIDRGKSRVDMAATSTHDDAAGDEAILPGGAGVAVRRHAGRRSDRPARVAWEVEPATSSLRHLRRAVASSLDELGVRHDDVVLVASEIVSGLIALTDRPIDVEVARRNDELTLAVWADAADDDSDVLDTWCRHVLGRLAVVIDDVVVRGDRRIVCTFGPPAT